ncbi:hypothetical protein CS063_04080 [Sporanaerobium hydrogeniformans]|uniref:Uncharacterized protein n=1 Tax=Sporanaerobium hydrogeniformans TaxID=3072179 RepID=A0AC61DFV9_9FIRM|nr:hypothetical protein CS063_04080 [Sporanaerobium hydrogeniformans]
MGPDKVVLADAPDAFPLSKKRKKHKSRNSKIVFLILLLALVGIGYSFRKPINQFIAPKVADIPFLNKLFKEKIEQNPYVDLNKDTLIRELEQKKLEIETLNQQVSLKEQEITSLQAKIKNLQEYEVKYDDFLKQKEEWDAQIAQTDKNLFISQFEKMYPDIAQKLYQDIKIDIITTKEQKNFSSMVANMDEEQAAKALEELIKTDPELVKVVVKGMQSERRSLILSNMSAQNAALVIKLVSPEENKVIQ